MNVDWSSISQTHDDLERITIGMASIPGRMAGMQATIEALLPQCDQFDLYLNGYPPGFHIPLFEDEKVNVFHGPADLGARGKLYLAHRTTGYFLSVDDDLNYPADYVCHTIQAIEKYERQAVLGYHGVIFTQSPDAMCPQGRMLFSHADELTMDLPVHMHGTGLMAYHSDTIQFDWRRMEHGKIDEQCAILGQETRTPFICAAHPMDWVTENDELKFVNSLRRNAPFSARAIERQQRDWQLYQPLSWANHRRNA
jgi:hypothetical protein